MKTKRSESVRSWEVVDAELAWVAYIGPDANEADSWKAAIEMQGHRAIVKEIKT